MLRGQERKNSSSRPAEPSDGIQADRRTSSPAFLPGVHTGRECLALLLLCVGDGPPSPFLQPFLLKKPRSSHSAQTRGRVAAWVTRSPSETPTVHTNYWEPAARPREVPDPPGQHLCCVAHQPGNPTDARTGKLSNRGGKDCGNQNQVAKTEDLSPGGSKGGWG